MASSKLKIRVRSEHCTREGFRAHLQIDTSSSLARSRYPVLDNEHHTHQISRIGWCKKRCKYDVKASLHRLPCRTGGVHCCLLCLSDQTPSHIFPTQPNPNFPLKPFSLPSSSFEAKNSPLSNIPSSVLPCKRYLCSGNVL